jgi:hypothetical protein
MHEDGRPLDTTEEAWRLQIDMFRRMSMAEKSRLTWQLSADARANAEAGERLRHPNAPEMEIRVRAAARYLGRETVMRVYGWDPESNEPFPDRFR